MPFPPLPSITESSDAATVCGIASKFYADRSDLYQQAMNCARLAAGSTLIGGQKSVEIVHAYILLSQYPVPARKWEESRCWVYMGLAMRYVIQPSLLAATYAVLPFKALLPISTCTFPTQPSLATNIMLEKCSIERVSGSTVSC